MSRFESITNVDIIYEAVAPQININWNPETNKGTVMFHVEHQEFHKIPDQEMQFVRREIDNRFQMRPLGVSIDQILADVYDIVLPDGTTTQIPGTLLMLTVKAAFEKYYNAKVAELEAQTPVDYPAEAVAPEA